MTDYADNYQQPSESDLALLSAYLDNELDDVTRQAVQARLAHEPLLQQALDELQFTCEMLRALPDAVPPRSFTLDPAQVAPRPTAPIWGSSWLVRLSGALTGLLVVMLTVGGLATLLSVPMQQAQPLPAAAPVANIDMTAVTREADNMATERAPLPTGGIAGSPDVAGSSHSTTLLPEVAADGAADTAPQAIPTAVQGIGASDTSSPNTREADVETTLPNADAPVAATLPAWVLILLGTAMLATAAGLLLWLRHRRT